MKHWTIFLHRFWATSKLLLVKREENSPQGTSPGATGAHTVSDWWQATLPVKDTTSTSRSKSSPLFQFLFCHCVVSCCVGVNFKVWYWLRSKWLTRKLYISLIFTWSVECDQRYINMQSMPNLMIARYQCLDFFFIRSPVCPIKEWSFCRSPSRASFAWPASPV